MTTSRTFAQLFAALSLALASIPTSRAADEPPAPVAPQTAGVELELPPQPEVPATDSPAPQPPAPTNPEPSIPVPPASEPAPAPSQPAPAPAPVPAPPAAQPQPPAVPVPPTFPGTLLANAAATFAATIKADHADGVYRLGERLRAEFVSERPAHLYLLYHQADGATKLLFPNRAHTDSSVGEGLPVQLPAQGEAFRFRIGLPLGNEVLQVLAATQPIAELDQIDRPTDRAPVVVAAVLEALAARIKTDPSLWTEHHTSIETVPGIGQAQAE